MVRGSFCHVEEAQWCKIVCVELGGRRFYEGDGGGSRNGHSPPALHTNCLSGDSDGCACAPAQRRRECVPRALAREVECIDGVDAQRTASSMQAGRHRSDGRNRDVVDRRGPCQGPALCICDLEGRDWRAAGTSRSPVTRLGQGAEDCGAEIYVVSRYSCSIPSRAWREVHSSGLG
jgi:hypothetical protein